MMTDPFAHGTPVGDSHMWVDPGQEACPDCPCCTVRLCATAKEQARTCAQIAGTEPRPGFHSVAGCRCALGQT